MNELNSTSRVPYQLWYSGVYDFDLYQFDLNEISDVYRQLSFYKNESRSVFEPRIFTYNCENDSNNGNPCSLSLIEESCISNGSFCIIFPSLPGLTLEHSSGFKEKHKLKFFEEILRQKCLYKQLPEFDKEEWFIYMNRFQSECFLKDALSFRYYNKECSSKILEDFEDFS